MGDVERGLQVLDANRTRATTYSELRVLTARAFLQSYNVPLWIVRPVIQRGFLYALTALWGHGKTALALLLIFCVGTGRNFGNASVRRREKLKALYLCGENPDDLRLRLKGMCAAFEVPEASLDSWLYLTERPFNVGDRASLEAIARSAESLGPFDIIVVDTGPAHFSGIEENDNVAMQMFTEHLRELMRRLGNPACIVLMHPSKATTKESLRPRGGGAFEGGVDGLLCLWREGDRAELWHTNKFRGPGFDRMRFRLTRFAVPGLRDEDGEAITTILMEAVQDTQAEEAKRENRHDETRLLLAIDAHPEASQRALAEACSWFGSDGKSQQYKVQRISKRLITNRLLTEDGRLTQAGKEAAKRALMAHGLKQPSASTY